MGMRGCVQSHGKRLACIEGFIDLRMEVQMDEGEGCIHFESSGGNGCSRTNWTMGSFT
jgi:hypothetical protein